MQLLYCFPGLHFVHFYFYFVFCLKHTPLFQKLSMNVDIVQYKFFLFLNLIPLEECTCKGILLIA